MTSAEHAGFILLGREGLPMGMLLSCGRVEELSRGIPYIRLNDLLVVECTCDVRCTECVICETCWNVDQISIYLHFFYLKARICHNGKVECVFVCVQKL